MCYTLQPELNLMLVNPAHLKGVKGRKTDPNDAAFLARAAASGMVIGSFVPERRIWELRDLTRRRTELIVARGKQAQRLEKELEDTGLTSVLSNVVGVSGRAILEALIAGRRDPARLAELTQGRARVKIPALTEALEGTFTDHHAFIRRHNLDEIDHAAGVIEHFDRQIRDPLTGDAGDLENLAMIPGIARVAAEVILAETGGDMAQFSCAAHLASWIGVCPGQNESAGVSKSGRTRQGNTALKRVLGVAAPGALRVKGSYLPAYYHRIAARRGGKRALVAVMHKLAVAIWHVLHDHTPYRDLGPEYYARSDPEPAIRRVTREANRLGLTVRFDPIEAIPT